MEFFTSYGVAILASSKNKFINREDIYMDIYKKGDIVVHKINFESICVGEVIRQNSPFSYTIQLTDGKEVRVRYESLRKANEFEIFWYIYETISKTSGSIPKITGNENTKFIIPSVNTANPIVDIMPEIENYTYIPETGTTIIEWSDLTKTVTKAENIKTADQLTGFMAAYAKKAAGNGNKINNLFDYWSVKKPTKEAEEKLKQDALNKEIERIKAKKKAKKESWAIRKRAKEIMIEQEAQKLAQEMMNKKSNGEVENN